MRRLASYTAIVLATLGVLLLLWQFRQVVTLFVLSLLAAAMIRPLIIWLVARELPAAAARTLVFVGLLAGLGLLFYFLAGPLVGELQQLTNQLTLAYEVTFARWVIGTNWQQSLTARLPQPTALYEALTGTDGILLLQTVFGVTQSILGAAAGFFLVLILSHYWSSEQDRFERLWLSLLPASQRVRARNTWREIETAIGTYFNSEFLQSLLAAFMIGGGMALLGVPYPVLLGLIAGIAWLVPLAGALVIVGVAFLAGFTVTLGLALLAFLYTLAVLCLLEFVVEPRLFNSQRYSSLLIILFMWPMAFWFGLGGLILAPPLAAAVELFVRQWLTPEPNNYKGREIVTLEKRYHEVYQVLGDHNNEAYTPEIDNILARLATLIQQSKMTLTEPPIYDRDGW
ncbi:MAG: AI-2E family transporter [Chloroflexi bacterium]|nr:AI-2E family transporter [Chloroflexota bacterium]MBP8058490.1 AI-2E family transporter [Chloroflexota bacterium]